MATPVSPHTTNIPLAHIKHFVDFYTLRGFHQHAYTLCSEYVARNGSHDHVVFWKAMAVAYQGQHVLKPCSVLTWCTGNGTDAIRELEPLQGRGHLLWGVRLTISQGNETWGWQ